MADVMVAVLCGLGVGLACWLWTTALRARVEKDAAERPCVRCATYAHEVATLTASLHALDGLVEMMKDQAAATHTRLLEVALPAREEPPVAEEPVGSPAEYDPPHEPVGDWTDPFFGLERQTVGGLAPGQAIPGIGQQAEEAYATGLSYGLPIEHGPVSDGAEEQVDYEAAGSAMFDQWDADRGGTPR